MTEVRVIDVAGRPYDVGLQFGQATFAQRDAVADSVERMCARIQSSSQTADLAEARDGLRRHSPETLEQIRGMSDALSIPAEQLLRSVLCTYLDDLAGAPRSVEPEGCSTWAGGGLLVKNRDYRDYHLPLQALLRVVPDSGIPWCALTSAGAPGVYGAGMNAAGLAIADTYVSAADVGPGIPRFSLMMHVLERAQTVADAIAYLRSVPIMGSGNLTLADSTGAVAVVECGYRRSGFLVRPQGWLVATNHFVTEEMVGSMRHSPDSSEGLDSCARADFLAESLSRSRIDEEFARSLMAHHDGSVGSLCRHDIPGSDARTIACLIAQPTTRQLTACFGFPCTDPFRTIDVLRTQAQPDA